MTIAVGIDPGLTTTGWATPDGCSGLIQSKLRGVERLDDIAKKTLQILDCFDPAFGFRLAISDSLNGLAAHDLLVAIESYSFGARNQAHQMGELGGVLRLTMWRERIRFIDVAPSAVKKFAGGKGNLKKDEMRLAVYKRWQREFATEHEVDGFVLAKIAEALITNPPDLIQPQVEVLDKLKSQMTAFENIPINGGGHGNARSRKSSPGSGSPSGA